MGRLLFFRSGRLNDLNNGDYLFMILARMLRSQEAPPGCPPRFYQSVALSVLACFVDDEDIITDASILFNIPEILNIIENSDSEDYEDDIMLISDAYKVLTGIV